MADWSSYLFPNQPAFGVLSPGEQADVRPGLPDKMVQKSGNDFADFVTGPGQLSQQNPYKPGTEDYLWFEDQRQKGMEDWSRHAAFNTMGTGGVVGAPVKAGEMAVGAGPIRAYHGSPYDFDKFDMSKIGTGEGAQAYGHGLYFAENERVAQQYRDDLANAISANGQRIMANNRVVGSTGNKSVDDMLMAHAGDVDAAIQDLKSHMQGLTPGQLARAGHQSDLDMLESLRGKVNKTNEGKMYEVNIDADPEHFLDWDKPLSEQHEKVRSALLNSGIVKKDIGQPGSAIAKYSASDPAAASAAMREAGIPGVKYLDEGSRNARPVMTTSPHGEVLKTEYPPKTHNYVVFNDRLINILRKYGLAGAIPAGAAAAGMQGDKNSSKATSVADFL